MNPQKKDSILAMILIIFSILLYFSSLKITSVKSAFFPLMLSFLLFFLSLFLLVDLQIKKKQNQKQNKKNNITNELRINWNALVFILIIFFSYRYFLEILGYILPTIFLTASTMWISGYKNKYIILIFSLLLSIGLYLSFTVIFKVPFPEGRLFDF